MVGLDEYIVPSCVILTDLFFFSHPGTLVEHELHTSNNCNVLIIVKLHYCHRLIIISIVDSKCVLESI